MSGLHRRRRFSRRETERPPWAAPSSVRSSGRLVLAVLVDLFEVGIHDAVLVLRLAGIRLIGGARSAVLAALSGTVASLLRVLRAGPLTLPAGRAAASRHGGLARAGVVRLGPAAVFLHRLLGGVGGGVDIIWRQGE